MSVNSFVLIIIVISLVIGAFLGIQFFKFNNRRIEKKLLKNAKEVLDGKKPNKIIIDGQEYDATKFLLRDNDGKQILIDLKGGGTIYEKRKETREESSKKPENTSDAREDSISPREKERAPGIRPISSRFRRFG